MSSFADLGNTPELVFKFSTSYVVPTGKYALLFVNNTESIINFTFFVPYYAGDTITNSLTGAIVKVYDLP